MSRVTLIHWHEAEAGERATRLRRAGHQVACPVIRSGADLRILWEDPPEAFVIDLERRFSQGRDLGILFRQRKATRTVPLVFVGGNQDKVGRLRSLLPEAVYTDWRRIRSGLKEALRSAPSRPATPGLMNGYSGTTLLKKLGIRDGAVVALLGAPAGFATKLALPASVRVRTQARGSADVILLFSSSVASLERRFPAAARALAQGGRLWLTWPKKSSEVATDLTQTAVRSLGLASGFVDYKIAAIDRTWSGLCFARRAPRRKK